MSKKSIEFHILSNDYFGTLGAILSLIRQSSRDNKFTENNIKILKNLEKDLILLQKNYLITKK
ncbi:MAG: hypothetical protein WC719_03420 [Patescibacteria group bacterium]|jgi:hypothetical protein